VTSELSDRIASSLSARLPTHRGGIVILHSSMAVCGYGRGGRASVRRPQMWPSCWLMLQLNPFTILLHFGRWQLPFRFLDVPPSGLPASSRRLRRPLSASMAWPTPGRAMAIPPARSKGDNGGDQSRPAELRLFSEPCQSLSALTLLVFFVLRLLAHLAHGERITASRGSRILSHRHLAIWHNRCCRFPSSGSAG